MLFRKLLLSTIILFVSGTSALAETIVLQSAQSGLYVSANGDGYLYAQYGLDNAMQLEMIRQDDGIVVFKSPDTGAYLRAGITAGTYLGLGGSNIGIWEKFHLIENNGLAYLRSAKNQLWVRAGIGQQSLLGAVSSVARGWEAFRIIPVSPAAAVQPLQNQSVDFAGDWEIFNLFAPDGREASFNDRTLRLSSFQIGEDGRFTAASGCNNISGRFEQQGPLVAVNNLLTTRMACEESVMRIEAALMDVLASAYAVAFSDRQLIIYDNNQTKRGEFRSR